MKVEPIHRATCHCGAVELELTLPNGIEDYGRCDCSFCRRRGAISAAVAEGNLRIVRGADRLTLYQFGSNTAEHYFCSACGTYTHHRRRSDPSQFGYNVGCLEGVNPFELTDVPVFDGINHPADRDPAN